MLDSKLKFRLLVLIFFYSLNYKSQENVCKTSLEEFQYMSWAIDSKDESLQSNFIKGDPISNNLNNIYFFTYTPVFRKSEKCKIGYSMTMINKKNDNIRTIGIPYDNPAEFENLFNEIMGWNIDEKNAFIKSYIIFQNTSRGNF